MQNNLFSVIVHNDYIRAIDLALWLSYILFLAFHLFNCRKLTPYWMIIRYNLHKKIHYITEKTMPGGKLFRQTLINIHYEKYGWQNPTLRYTIRARIYRWPRWTTLNTHALVLVKYNQKPVPDKPSDIR